MLHVGELTMTRDEVTLCTHFYYSDLRKLFNLVHFRESLSMRFYSKTNTMKI